MTNFFASVLLEKDEVDEFLEKFRYFYLGHIDHNVSFSLDISDKHIDIVAYSNDDDSFVDMCNICFNKHSVSIPVDKEELPFS